MIGMLIEIGLESVATASTPPLQMEKAMNWSATCPCGGYLLASWFFIDTVSLRRGRRSSN